VLVDAFELVADCRGEFVAQVPLAGGWCADLFLREFNLMMALELPMKFVIE
jgi:hypothetical protein